MHYLLAFYSLDHKTDNSYLLPNNNFYKHYNPVNQRLRN